MLNMVRSSYYYKEGVNLQKQKEEADLRDRIEKIVVEYERYGYRRVTAALQREGLKVNHKRVQRIMQEEELICMSRKGNPYDNAQAESFMKTLKNEEVYLWDYKTFEDVKKRIPYFIEEVYNEKRLHSALGYCPPNEYESLVARNENRNRQTQLTSEVLCV
ncbi:MAG TPA: IS3 family transposase [Thermodesulfovibrionales bacterium]|jgi:transposase InsO family protein|nr:IS3 family transposase [Thermodesulfovibrionales bacterium]